MQIQGSEWLERTRRESNFEFFHAVTQAILVPEGTSITPIHILLPVPLFARFKM